MLKMRLAGGVKKEGAPLKTKQRKRRIYTLAT
jgi:hypothetical protein